SGCRSSGSSCRSKRSVPDGMADSMTTTAQLYAGASGFSYKEWKGNFYPSAIKADEMLKWYSERLPTVELNNTFYRMPKKSAVESRAASTRANFRFAIKAA